MYSVLGRDGWPLLTDETEENGDSKSTNERGPSLVGSLGLSALAATAQYKNFFFLPTLFQLFCPIGQQAWQAAVLGRLSLNMCLWCYYSNKK